MSFVYPNLVSEMNKRGLGYKDIADILDIDKFAAYRRLRGLAGWRLDEIMNLCEYFDSSFEWLFKKDVTDCDI